MVGPHNHPRLLLVFFFTRSSQQPAPQATLVVGPSAGREPRQLQKTGAGGAGETRLRPRGRPKAEGRTKRLGKLKRRPQWDGHVNSPAQSKGPPGDAER